MPQAAIQRIEQFLYGSNAQWRVNQLHEDSATPMQRLGIVEKTYSEPDGINYWSSCEVSTAAASDVNCIAGLVGSQPRKGEVLLLVHRLLESDIVHTIQIHSRSGLRTLHATTSGYETILTGLGNMYLYRVALQVATAVSVASNDTLGMDSVIAA
ncbi:MAG: hypothetical protein IV089_11295 [Thiobacillus sp.]|nr:hypothetical protein [Thiobacillus sp.]